MSGHSKWNNIAKRKGANDAKKAKIFTKIGREMAIAIKEGGSANPDFNARLRDCIAKAKANNMPENRRRTGPCRSERRCTRCADACTGRT